jgi:hypothetical protein
LVRRRPKSSQRKVPVAATPAASGYEMDPLEYQLALMNDESLPPKQRAAIAKKLLQYFHQKPKPVRPEQLYDSFIENHPTEEDEDPGSASDERARLRKNLFGRFD